MCDGPTWRAALPSSSLQPRGAGTSPAAPQRWEMNLLALRVLPITTRRARRNVLAERRAGRSGGGATSKGPDEACKHVRA